MLEDLLGKIAFLLPVEILATISVLGALWKFGTLQRMAVTLNLWLMAMVDANKARSEFQQRLQENEAMHESHMEEIHAQSLTQALSAHNLEQSRFRQLLLDELLKRMDFLECEVKQNNEFFREVALHEFKRTDQTKNNEGVEKREKST